MQGFIYKWTNVINDKVYIGLTINRKRRYKEFINSKNYYTSNNPDNLSKIDKARIKYGVDNFKYEILEEIENKDKEELIRNLDLLEEYYIELYDSIKNGYNTIKGGSSYVHKERTINSFSRKINKEFLIYPDEPVVDTKTGIVYKDVIEWISLCNLDREEFYNLYMNKSFRYRYLNQNKLRYPGECLPIDATIEDILTGKAIPIVCLPIPDNEEGGIEKFKDIDVKVSKNTEDIEYLKKENEQLKEEIKALKENRKSKYII